MPRTRLWVLTGFIVAILLILALGVFQREYPDSVDPIPQPMKGGELKPYTGGPKKSA